MAKLRNQQQARRLHEVDSDQRWLDRNHKGPRPHRVLGPSCDLLHGPGLSPAALCLGVSTRGPQIEARIEVSRSPVQQGVYRKEARLDLEYQAAAGAHGIPPGQGLQAKRQVRAAVSRR